jgi:anti-sigma B factor antagonist
VPYLLTVEFGLEVRHFGDRTVIGVCGDLDVLTAPQLRDRLIEVVEAGQRVLFVDLTDCQFIDSSGLSALVTGHKRVTSVGGHLDLVCPGGNVRRLIEVVALDQVFTIHERLAGAPG